VIISYNNITKVDFPVFPLPSGDWEVIDGLLLLDDKILDDKNMVGKTLGARRMQTPHKNIYPLKKMIASYNGILKQKSNYFIDNLGRPFYYHKKRFAQLKYLKIKRVEKKEVASLVWVTGFNAPFTVLRPPEDGMFWAGVLHLQGLPWVLYEYSETKLKDTKKKV